MVALLLGSDAAVEALDVGGDIAGGCETQRQGGKDGVSKRRHFYETSEIMNG